MHRTRRTTQRLIAALGRRVAGTVTQVETDEPIAAITFDDGPDPVSTPQLLEVLDRHDVRATFFMVGARAEKYPKVVAEVATRGHEVANHSWDHTPFPSLSSRGRREQLRACQGVIHPYASKLFRPPYGDQDVRSRLDLLLAGYTVVTWNVVGVDWTDDPAEMITRRVIEGISPGSIILLHDALYTSLSEHFFGRDAMLEAVDQILGQLGKIYEFTTVSNLIARGNPVRDNWYQRNSPDFFARLIPASQAGQ